MKEIEIYIILYSYVIPTLIMFMFGWWQVYSKLRAKKVCIIYYEIFFALSYSRCQLVWSTYATTPFCVR